MSICTVDECNSERRSTLYCAKHYEQLKKHGKVLTASLRDFNDIIDKGNYYELILLNKKSEEVGRAKIDKEDLDKIKIYGRWGLDKQGYIFNTKHRIGIHRVVMNASSEEMVDHKKPGSEHRRDNRKKNLRICTNSQNQHNRGKSITNTSGYKGVSWDKNAKAWRARIAFKGKKYCFGYHASPEIAYKAYCKGAKKLVGAFFRAD